MQLIGAQFDGSFCYSGLFDIQQHHASSPNLDARLSYPTIYTYAHTLRPRLCLTTEATMVALATTATSMCTVLCAAQHWRIGNTVATKADADVKQWRRHRFR